MSAIPNQAGSAFLRRVLFIDALLSAGSGLAMAFAAGPLAQLTALPVPLLRGAGIVLLPFAAFVYWLSRHEPVARAAVWSVIAVNVAWVVESLWLLIGGWVQPSVLGTAYVLVQAVAVAVLAELEYVGLRRGAAVFAQP